MLQLLSRNAKRGYPKLHSSDINHRSLATAQIQNSFGSEMSLEAASRPGDPNYKDGTMMENQKSKPEEQLAASAVATLASTQDKGLASSTLDEAVDVSTSSTSLVTRVTRESTPEPRDSSRTLGSYPYFFYQDFSTVADPDPLAPLTPPGRVPNFPAKMHSILSRQDLAHIACWNPHGRSWRILKPREFEQEVIPTYFEHAKFSSFIRQANGWGFRRISQGRDRGTYYHEMFLRGLPHLCKMMKRPAVSEKQAADPDHEPDFLKISEEKPVPDRPVDDSILLKCVLEGGPKARMPIYQESYSSKSCLLTSSPSAPIVAPPHSSYPNQMTHAPVTLQLALPQSVYVPAFNGQDPIHASRSSPTACPQAPAPLTQCQHHLSTPSLTSIDSTGQVSPMLNPLTVMPPALQADPAAAAQFAAGFAAAAALSQQSFRSALNQVGVNQYSNVNVQNMPVHVPQPSHVKLQGPATTTMHYSPPQFQPQYQQYHLGQKEIQPQQRQGQYYQPQQERRPVYYQEQYPQPHKMTMRYVVNQEAT